MVIALLGLIPYAWSGAGDARAWAAEMDTLASPSAVRALTKAQAGKSLPVSFEAIVTFYRDSGEDLLVQIGDAGSYVRFKAGAGLQVGDRVLVSGHSDWSAHPIVVADEVSVVRHDALPDPVPSSYEQLAGLRSDGTRVRVQAEVRAVSMADAGPKRSAHLEVLMDGGYVNVLVNSADEGAIKKLLDAQVEVTGVATAGADQKTQGPVEMLYVQSLADVKVLKPAAVNADMIPFTLMEDILGSHSVQDLSKRVRVRGTITYYRPGSGLVLQDGSKGVWVSTMVSEPLHVGDIAEVSGFPDLRGGYPELAHAGVTDTQGYAPISPTPIHWQGAGSGGNAFNLVSIQARVVRHIHEVDADQFVLDADGHLFSAVYRHPGVASAAHPVQAKEIPVGSMVRVTGILSGSDPMTGAISSGILLQSLDGMVVTAPPSLLNLRNLIYAVGILLFVVLILGVRSWRLNRRLQGQMTAMAEREEKEGSLQRKRGEILEGIKSSRSFAEVVEEITRMVSSQLDGAPCWCEVADGTQLGERPTVLSDMRIVRKEIATPGGEVLGILFAALDLDSLPEEAESEALAEGAGLAAIAHAIQHVSSDPDQRPEPDVSSDVHNLSSLGIYLEDCIAEARQAASVIALICINLDDFKVVLETHGRHAVDLYLQQVIQRMKRQLRSADMLARLEGEELVVLAPDLHSRAAAEEITLRLKRCFHEAFVLEGRSFFGTASIGLALSPEDGVTQEILLAKAEAEMRKGKEAKQAAHPLAEAESRSKGTR